MATRTGYTVFTSSLDEDLGLIVVWDIDAARSQVVGEIARELDRVQDQGWAITVPLMGSRYRWVIIKSDKKESE